MSAPAGNGFVRLVAADASEGDGFVGLVVMKMQVSAGGWQASAGSDDDAGWQMECERRLADGKRQAPAGGNMMRVSAGKWSASVGWWMASVGWRMECKRWLADGERRLLAAMMQQAFVVQASAGRW